MITTEILYEIQILSNTIETLYDLDEPLDFFQYSKNCHLVNNQVDAAKFSRETTKKVAIGQFVSLRPSTCSPA